MIKAVLMDLGKTILDNHSINFDEGLKAVFKLSASPNITLVAFLEKAKKLDLTTYQIKRKANLEISLSYFLHKLNQECDNIWPDFEEKKILFEDVFYEACEKNAVIAGVIPFLNFLKEQKIPIVVVSNSTFSSLRLKKELDKHQLSCFFEAIYSSADLGYRKPCPCIFIKPFLYLSSIVDKLKPNEVCYIGDSFEYDVIAGKQFNMLPLWFNANITLVKNSIYQFSNYQQLIKDWPKLL